MTVNSERARDLYFKYCAGVAYVAVTTPAGDSRIGTAFHVGDNIWVTARHVVDGKTIEQVATTRDSISDYTQRLHENSGLFMGEDFSPAGNYQLASGPLLHPDPAVDVAVLKLEGPYSTLQSDEPVYLGDRGQPTPIIKLGGWLDDWLGDDLTLEPVVVMGYPPIPFGSGPLLVSTLAEVNTVLDKRSERHPYFILSALARGGFSGAPAITDFENSLGVAAEALVMDNQPSQLGYFAVLSVEPIYNCLKHHYVLPKAQEMPGIYDASG